MRVDGISIIGRNTQGVRLMTMDEEELVVSLARLIPEDEEEELEGEEGLEGASDSEDAEVGAEGEEE
ncbi:MAG: DNA gyrase C-terminal beta-propeller domain-containing protein, partial [Myxococcota bacterium]|nr:DNA gyrase C-terminal beta-propeller domain-containing protein [Myxococcota bacterium]